MVKFMGALDHAKENGYYSKELGFLQPPFEVFAVLKGRKEYVVIAEPEIIEQLKLLPNDSYMFQKMSVVKKYLDKNGILWEECGKASII